MKLSKKLLALLLELAREARPREVGGLLLASGGVVNDFVLLPGQFTTHSVYVRDLDVPIYVNSVGTFHTHPAPRGSKPGAWLLLPSRADKDFFSRTGRLHLIIAESFSARNVTAWDGKGKPVRLELQE